VIEAEIRVSGLVVDGDDYLIAWRSRFELMHPLTEAAGVVLRPEEHGTRPVDEHAAQVDVAALADAAQLRLASGGVLTRDHPEPGGKLPSLTESRSVTYGGDGGCGYQRSDSRDLSQGSLF